jgi:hypothetical protein
MKSTDKMNYEKLSRVLIIIGICFTIFFGLEFIFNTCDLRCGPIDPAIWGQYGDVVGGFVGMIVAVVGVFLLFETLKQQRITYTKQQVETRFFELLKLHRDNVIEMHSKGTEGRSVFVVIKDEFHDLFDRVSQCYSLETSGLPNASWKKNLIQITYLILFFGVDNSSTDYLKKEIKKIIIKDNVYEEFEKGCLDELIKKHKQTKEKNKNKKKNNEPI